MSEIQLVIREADADWSGAFHSGYAERAIASLSADPYTLAELEAAFERFEKPDPKCRPFGNLTQGLCDQPAEGGLVVIDLVARLVVVDSKSLSLRQSGTVRYHDGKVCTSNKLRFHLMDDWLLTDDATDWQLVAHELRRQRSGESMVDIRTVLYGRPLFEFIAEKIHTSFYDRQELSDGETLRAIHVAWMLTPLKQLGGHCPREMAIDQLSHIEQDLRDRQIQWLRLNNPPPGLASTSIAYRMGGFGPHEFIKYYELVRYLLHSSWERLHQYDSASRQQASNTEPIPRNEFVEYEYVRLGHVRDSWLDSKDGDGRTPRSVIEGERTRIPQFACCHTISDPDCQVCELVDCFGEPQFLRLCQSHLELDYAFDMECRSREIWDERCRELLESNARVNEAWEELDSLEESGAVDDDEAFDLDYDDEFDSEFAKEKDELVSRTLRDWAQDDFDDDLNGVSGPIHHYVPPSVRMLGLASQFVELVADLLRIAVDQCANSNSSDQNNVLSARSHIDQLTRNIGNLHHVCASATSLSEALLQPTLEQLTESLSSIAKGYPQLATRCDALGDSIREMIKEVAGDDIPF